MRLFLVLPFSLGTLFQSCKNTPLITALNYFFLVHPRDGTTQDIQSVNVIRVPLATDTNCVWWLGSSWCREIRFSSDVDLQKWRAVMSEQKQLRLNLYLERWSASLELEKCVRGPVFILESQEGCCFICFAEI